jgi:hypothetical protein
MALALKRALTECETGKGITGVNAALAKISPTLKATLDFDSIKALQVCLKLN